MNRNQHPEASASGISMSGGCAVVCQLLAHFSDVLAHLDAAPEKAAAFQVSN